MIWYVDHQIPRPDEDSGSLRAHGILRVLRALGRRVTVFADDPRPRSRHLKQLADLGVAAAPAADLSAHLAGGADPPDLVIIARVEVAVRVMPILCAHRPRLPVIFDTVDLHYRRFGREAALRRDPSASLRALAVKVEELGVARASDLVWVVSEDERQALLAEDARLRVEVVSNIHDIPADGAQYGPRRGLGFVGGFNHRPNVDAVEYLVSRIMPRIWDRRADIELDVVGADTPPEIRALEGPRVRVLGYQRDLGPFLERWRALAAPLRYGAGVKGKITQALSVGLPAVTTWLGAEGIGLRHGEHILIADTPETFAAAVLELYDNREYWERVSRAGQAHMRAHFSFEEARARIHEDLVALTGRHPVTP